MCNPSFQTIVTEFILIWTCLGVAHPPELDLAVVGAGDDERHVGVEGGPVDAAVVPLQHVLHHGVSLTKQVRGVSVSLDLILKS